MAVPSLLTDEARALVGRTSPPGITVVEKTAIVRFAEAIGDPNPLYYDEEYARRTPFGGIIAPPTFVYTLKRGPLPDLPIATTRLLNGGDAFEFGPPIRPGDTIVAVSRWADLYERVGRNGPMVFTIWETTYTNQHGVVVAEHRATRIRY
ncbi:MAG: MaoC family dehydratase N-terminal domain-containing protein [Dehalococcoidia bacterium]|nr:MaoC family dehydratase N-terminal domain-containing protein [Dehalococcoidia bacterium]